MLSITGRIKDMIIRGGINIFPAEVERVYSSNDIVADCCVVGYPDQNWASVHACALFLSQRLR